MLSNRRQFLKGIGIFSCSALCLPRFAGATQQGKISELYSETRLLMGTMVNLKATHIHKDFVYESFDKAFAEMVRIEALLTRHKSSSALSLLNSQKKLARAPQDLINVAIKAQEIEKMSGGAFNPSVLPVLEYLETQNTISNAEIKELFALVQKNSIQIQGNSILLSQGDMKITLDGIAKGYIVDKAAQVLEACGLQDFLINAGGDIRAKGMKQASLLAPEPWHIAIEDPNKQNNYPAVLPLYNGALASSGSYEKKFATGLHHIIMPNYVESTSLSASQYISSPMRSVSVLAPTAMEADALATALSCMSVKSALNLVHAMPTISCFIIAQDDSVHSSKNWG